MPQTAEPPDKSEQKTEVGLTRTEKEARFRTYSDGWDARGKDKPRIPPFSAMQIARTRRWRQGYDDRDRYEAELAREQEMLQALERS